MHTIEQQIKQPKCTIVAQPLLYKYTGLVRELGRFPLMVMSVQQSSS